MKKSILIVLASILIFIPVEYHASETIPHSFSAGDTISAEMMNEIFSEIKNVTYGFSSGADIVGTWTCTRTSIDSACITSTGLDNTSNSIYSADSNGITYTASGTLILTDDGDGTYSWNSSFSLSGQCDFMSEHVNSQTRDYDIIEGSRLVLTPNTAGRNHAEGKTMTAIKKLSPSKFSMNLTSHTSDEGVTFCTKTNLKPSPPYSLTYANSSSSITLTWTDNNTEVTGYKVIRKTVVTDNFTTVSTITDNTTRTYADTDVSTGSYWYRVRAYNSNGDGTPSKVVKSEFP